MVVHVFEDGSAVLAAREPGKPGAVTGVRAAIDLRDEIEESAITVFANAEDDDDVSDTIDRGATMHEQAQMHAVFADIEGADPSIRVDDAVADLLEDEFPMSRGEHGASLDVSKKQRT
jgi:hypothetical protein